MSDDTGNQGNTGYPPPPSGGMAPPPPPPPPGTFAPPSAPPAAAPGQPVAPGPVATEQPPKKRTGLVIGIAVAVVLCGIVACIAAAIGFGVMGGDSDTKAAVVLAETHYGKAQEAVGVASGWLDGLESGSAKPEDVKAAVEDSTKAIRTARDELAAAKAAIEPIEDSPGKTQYLASLEQATVALDGIEDLLAYVQKASGMAAIVVDAGNASRKATENLNDAIGAGNASKYSKMKTEAKAAVAGYAKAATLFDQAHKIDPTAGIDKAAAYARKRKQQADVVLTMADYGKAKKISAYNKQIKKMNRLGAEADKIGDPAIVSDPNWLQSRLADLNEAATTAATKADELHASALEALGYSE